MIKLRATQLLERGVEVAALSRIWGYLDQGTTYWDNEQPLVQPECNQRRLMIDEVVLVL